jgi:hypothetical protein
LLLLASIIAVALIIERLVALRRAKVVPPGLLQRVVGEFQQRAATRDGRRISKRIRRSAACWPPACATSAVRARS